MEIVVDTTILIAAFLKTGITRRIIFLAPFTMYTIPYVKTEIEKHADHLQERCHLDETTFSSLIDILMEQIELVDQERINPYKNKALKAMRDRDIDDAPILALAMALECPIWSNDEDLKEQKQVKVYTTNELLEVLETM